MCGLAGGKGVPADVADHACTFVTLTAPSFGAVHGQRRTGSIQNAMGRESITTTARIHADLHDEELDNIAAALDGLYATGHTVGQICEVPM